MSRHDLSRGGNVIGWRIFAYVFMAVFTILTVGPLFWLIYSSFKPHADIALHMFAFPNSFFVENYQRAWRLGQLGTLILNSIFYAGVATVVTVYLALAAGYAFGKLGFKISKVFLATFLTSASSLAVNSGFRRRS